MIDLNTIKWKTRQRQLEKTECWITAVTSEHVCDNRLQMKRCCSEYSPKQDALINTVYLGMYTLDQTCDLACERMVCCETWKSDIMFLLICKKEYLDDGFKTENQCIQVCIFGEFKENLMHAHFGKLDKELQTTTTYKCSTAASGNRNILWLQYCVSAHRMSDLSSYDRINLELYVRSIKQTRTAVKKNKIKILGVIMIVHCCCSKTRYYFRVFYFVEFLTFRLSFGVEKVFTFLWMYQSRRHVDGEVELLNIS